MTLEMIITIALSSYIIKILFNIKNQIKTMKDELLQQVREIAGLTKKVVTEAYGKIDELEQKLRAGEINNEEAANLLAETSAALKEADAKIPDPVEPTTDAPGTDQG